MTPRQTYSELAKVFGRRVGPESRPTSFCRAKTIGKDDLKAIQAALFLILEKINYGRAHNDFGRVIRESRASTGSPVPVSAPPLEDLMLWASIEALEDI